MRDNTEVEIMELVTRAGQEMTFNELMIELELIERVIDSL